VSLRKVTNIPSRRSVLRNLGGVATLGIPGLGIGQALLAEDPAFHLTRIFSNHISAYVLGMTVINAEGSQCSTIEAWQRLMAEVPGLENAITNHNLSTVRQCLAKSIAHDFVENSVVYIDGWMLSRTEASLLTFSARYLQTSV